MKILNKERLRFLQMFADVRPLHICEGNTSDKTQCRGATQQN